MKSVPRTRPLVAPPPGQSASLGSGYGLRCAAPTVPFGNGGGLDQPALRAVGVALLARTSVRDQEGAAACGVRGGAR